MLPSPALHPSVPIPTLLRPPVPQRIQLTAVPTGASRSGTAGRYAGAAGTVTARVEGDDAGLFAVVQLETDRPVRDPDAPPGHPPLIVLETVQTVDGAGPIGVEPGEALLATVEFRCPAYPRKDTYWAVVELDGLTLPAPPGAGAAPAPGPARIAVSAAPDAHVDCQVAVDGPLTRGGSRAYPFVLTSTLGHDVDVLLDGDPGYEPHVLVEPQEVHLPAGGRVTGGLTFTAASVAFAGVLHRVLQRLAHDEERGRLDRARQPAGRQRTELDRQRAPPAERRDGRLTEQVTAQLAEVATHVQHVFTKLDLPDGPLDNRRVLAVLAFLDR